MNDGTEDYALEHRTNRPYDEADAARIFHPNGTLMETYDRELVAALVRHAWTRTRAQIHNLRTTIVNLPAGAKQRCREEMVADGFDTPAAIEAAGVEGLEAAKTIVAGYVAAAAQEAV